jgi:hypothetical protein
VSMFHSFWGGGVGGWDRGTAGVSLRACLGELQLRKNSSRAADPRSSTVEQLHRGSEI